MVIILCLQEMQKKEIQNNRNGKSSYLTYPQQQSKFPFFDYMHVNPIHNPAS